MNTRIQNLHVREILDSRGNPTVEIEVMLANGAFGVMTRASPQLNIFAVGFPITILLGFVVMLITLPYFIPKLQQSFEQVFHFIGSTLIAKG